MNTCLTFPDQYSQLEHFREEAARLEKENAELRYQMLQLGFILNADGSLTFSAPKASPSGSAYSDYDER